MKNDIIYIFNIKNDRISGWTDATSLEHFNYEKNIFYGTKIRKEFNIENKFVVFYHGHITTERGLVDCAKAMIELNETCPEIILFLLGHGPAVSKIKIIIKNNKLKNIILHEPVDYVDVPKYIALADIGIVPLPNLKIWANQVPNKLLEYLSMKKPVIVSDINPHREVVNSEPCALFFENTGPHNIKVAILEAHRKKRQLYDCAFIGRNIIKEKYNWVSSSKVLEKYLIDLAEV
jgi:glycosyltransferase involved in cell wall biosynthesis